MAYEAPVYLRALELSDLERVLSWHNDQALYNHLGGTFRWVSRKAEEEWLQRRCTYSATEVNLAIGITSSHEHIGNVYLRNIDWTARNAELHIFIGQASQRGTGHGEAAMRQVLSFAFHDLGLQRIYLYLLASNEPALRLYRKCGFVEEGRLRRHAFKRGLWEDVLIMGILHSEWETHIDQ